jgi:UDP-N-acetylmuramoyl-tripeptide--D-alanyl-D-alanine ligase
MTHAVTDFLERNHPRPLLILGDMAELGDVSEQAHEDLAALVIHSDVHLWTVGAWFGKIYARQTRAKWRHFERCDDVVTYLKESPLRGHQILIKGSRSIGLERLMPNL